MSTLICFALKEEAAPFRKIAAGETDLSTFIVGIGRANAEKSLRAWLATELPDLVLTCGFAGGLHPDLKLGDVVFELPIANPPLTTRLLAAGAKPATIHCADRIATTVAEKKQLRYATSADAGEMESAAIHAVCAESAIPCATVRVMAWAIAKSPGKIPQLMQLQKKTKFAAERLADVLEKITSEKPQP